MKRLQSFSYQELSGNSVWDAPTALWTQKRSKKAAIDKRTTAIAKKIASRNGKDNLGLKTKGMFYIMRMMQKNGWNSRDVGYMTISLRCCKFVLST